MAEREQYEVEFEYTSVGAAKVNADLDRLLDRVDDLARNNQITEKAQDKLSGAIVRTQRSVRDNSKATQDLGSATRNARGEIDGMQQSIVALRYANYDVGRTMLGVSAAITAAGAATATAFASQERAFTEVERIVEGDAQAVQTLRDELTKLSTEVPRSFQELSSVASLGAALNIPADALDEFTATVSKFAALTGVTEEAAATGFGRIAQYLNVASDEYESLGSAILRAGNISVATEEQVLKFSQAIALPAARTGLLADEVVALGAATASFANINVEGAGSAFSRVFANIERSVVEGGESLENFAAAAGLSAAEFKTAWGSQSGDTFNRILRNLSTDAENLTTNMDALGIRNERDRRIVSALALNYEEYARILGDTTSAWREGIYMNEAYGLVLDDLSTKWEIFKNALTNAAAAVGSEIAPALKELLTIATDTLVSFTEFAKSDLGAFLIRLVGSLALATASFTGLRGAIALATGSAQAMQFAFAALGGPGILNGIRNLAASLGLVKSGADTATASMGTLGGTAAGAGAAGSRAAGSFSKFAKGGGIVGGVLAVSSAMADLRGTTLGLIDASEWWFNTVWGWTSGIKPLVGTIYGLAEAFGWVDTSAATSAINAESVAGAFGVLGNVITVTFSVMANQAAAAARAVSASMVVLAAGVARAASLVGIDLSGVVSGIQNMAAGIQDFSADFSRGFTNGVNAVDRATPLIFGMFRDLANRLPGASSGVNELGNSFGDLAGGIPDASDGLDDFADKAGDAGDSAADAAKEVRTLIDYASDLAEVWGRAFEIRFSGQQTMDEITSGFTAIRDRLEEARKSMRDLRNDIRGLQSDISIQEYYLSIAIEYGDTKRAQAIEAELAKKRAELADKTQDLEEAQDKASTSLNGNSKGAIENRKSLLDLVAAYQSHLQALAASGMSQAELDRETARLKQQFIQQATQLGYNRAELGRYARAFDDVRVAISKIPRNVTVTANTNPAIQAFNEWSARANSAMASVQKGVQNTRNMIGGGISIPVSSGGAFAVSEQMRILGFATQVVAMAKMMQTYANAGNLAMAGSYATQLAYLRAKIVSGGWAQGGYTGAGGKYEPAGIVHRGEYVIPKRDVNQATGMPYADALGRLMNGQRGYASGGYVRQAPQTMSAVVSLSAGSIQQIAQAVRPYLVVGDEVIAGAAERQFTHQTSVGAY